MFLDPDSEVERRRHTRSYGCGCVLANILGLFLVVAGVALGGITWWLLAAHVPPVGAILNSFDGRDSYVAALGLLVVCLSFGMAVVRVGWREVGTFAVTQVVSRGYERHPLGTFILGIFVSDRRHYVVLMDLLQKRLR